MKNLLATLLPLLLLALPPARAQELPAPLATYRDGCLALTQAIAKADKYLLYEAQEKLTMVKTADFSVLLPADDATRNNTEKPTVAFTAEYVDQLIAKGFSLTELDDPSFLRGTNDGEVLIHHAALPPGATLTWNSLGYGLCALTAIPCPEASLTLTVTDNITGKTYTADTPAGQAPALVWQLPEDCDLATNFTFALTNHSDKTASVVIAEN